MYTLYTFVYLVYFLLCRLRTTDNGQRTTDNGLRTTDNGLLTTDCSAMRKIEAVSFVKIQEGIEGKESIERRECIEGKESKRKVLTTNY